MTPHSHISPIGLLASVAATVAILGTVHLLVLSNGDTRFGRAFASLGF